MENDMNILGIMSGTSLDGLDLTICSFWESGKKWIFRIHAAETIQYTEEWIRKLQSAPHLSGIDLLYLHQEYGQFIADNARFFIQSSGLKVDLISSHGHTVFHQPEAGFTMQAGDPQVIATSTGITTAGDFRKTDVLLGGQGAPLVTVGDQYLFGEYDFCLNLGGFANISYISDEKRLARDVCPVNIILNQLAGELDLPYDRDGFAGRSGNVSETLLGRLNSIGYYQTAGPGSLGREWLDYEFMPVIRDFNLPVTDILRTVYEHISLQIARQIRRGAKVLVTGGGAYNQFLVEKIREVSHGNIIIPSSDLIEYKEALIFAFLGLLRLHERINCFASVTGASRDSCCGVIYRSF
jgi:anhydro-N-acetylmuramic acid kinase